MAQLTITEALAEIKTINARIAKKREAIFPYVARDGRVLDPHTKVGGTPEWISRERQAIADLEQRLIDLRCAIQQVNLTTMLTLGGRTRSLGAWLTWRREVRQGQADFLSKLFATVQQVRQKAPQQQRQVVGPNDTSQLPPEQQFLVCIDETQLTKELEDAEQTFGELDGKLSLLNATTFVTV